jgi:WD40 repeat protein
MKATIVLMLLTAGAAAEEVRHDLYGDPLPKGARMRLGTVRFRHGGYEIMGVSYSPDGKLLATCGFDGLVRLWDARTGEEYRRLAGHTNTPTNLAFSPDGKMLASGDEDSTVRLWEVATGKLLRAIKEEGPSFSLVFTRDGKRLASGTADERIRLWGVATGKCSRTLEGHEEGDIHLSLSPDGQLLASASWDDGTICLWDMAVGKLVRKCGQRKGRVHHVQFAPDGKTLATCCEDGSIHLWDAATGKEVRQWKAHEREVHTVVFRADGRTLFSGSGDGTIREWDAATGKEVRVLTRCLGMVHAMSRSPDGKMLAAVGWDLVVRRWDLANGKEMPSPRGHEATIDTLRFTADDKTLLSTAEDGTARVWDTATGKELHCDRAKLAPGDDSPRIAVSFDGRLLAVGTTGEEEDYVRLWDRGTGKVLASFPTAYRIERLRFSPDGKTLAAGTDSSDIIHLWDVGTRKERCRIVGLWPLVFSADSGLLAAPDAMFRDKPEGGIHLWKSANGKEVCYIPRPDKDSALYPLCFSADGRMLAGWHHHTDKKASEPGVLVVWEAATGRERFRLHTKGDETFAAAFSPDGATLAAGGMEQTIHLWDIRNGKERPCFRGDQGEVRSLAFSRDGRQLASGGKNTSILLWPIAASPRTQAATDKDLPLRELQALWTNLAGDDTPRAFQAMKTLYASPASTAVFLREHLRPVTALDAETTRRLLAKLESDDLTTRERATKELGKLGDVAESLLRQALRQKPSLELRRRAERLLEKLAVESPKRLRTRRAVEVLEWLETPESRRLLEELAGGEADAWLTREAKAVLRRRPAR